jgi:hypothetical protein
LFRLMVSETSLPHCWGPGVGQTIMAARTRGRAKLLTSWWPGSRETDRKGRDKMTCKGMPQ